MGAVKSTEPVSSIHDNYHHTTFLLVVQNSDVNGNKQLSRVYVLPLCYVREVSCLAVQAPKGCSCHLSKVNIHHSKEGYSRMQKNLVKYGDPLFPPDLHCFHSMSCDISVQRTKGRLRKKPKYKQNCSSERCPSTLFSSATMPGLYKPILSSNIYLFHNMH